MKTELTLAREAIRIFLEDFKLMKISGDLPPSLIKTKAGVYVTLERPSGEIRGLGGTIHPTRPNIASEIVSAAVAAGFHSPGFLPLNKVDLHGLRIKIDIIRDLTPVTKNHKLDLDLEGVLTETLDGRRGVILPGCHDSKTMTELINLACRQAKINPQEEHYKIFVFTTESYIE